MNAAAGPELPFPPEVFVPLFFVGFALFWCAILGGIAAFGWRRIEAAYPATSDPPDSAARVYWATLSIGGAIGSPNYGSCINAWLSPSGLWLRPTLLFRPFHPMIFIPWTAVESIERRRWLFLFRVRIVTAGGVPDLLLMGRLGRAVLKHWQGTTKSSR